MLEKGIKENVSNHKFEISSRGMSNDLYEYETSENNFANLLSNHENGALH